MPSILSILFTFVVCALVASFLAKWLLKGTIDLANTRTCALLILALAVVCYVNSFVNNFVWDDTTLIRDNPRVRSLQDWKKRCSVALNVAVSKWGSRIVPIRHRQITA
jgi:hypothetical protein